MNPAHRLDAADLAAVLPRLRRFARVLVGGQGGADDLLLEALAGARSRGRGASEDDLMPWLFGLVHAAYRRDLQRQPRRFAGGGGGDAATADLCARVLRLPLDEREVLVLVAVERLAYADAARVLDVPIATVLSRLARARERLSAA